MERTAAETGAVRGQRACRRCGDTSLRPSRPRGLLEERLRAATRTRYHQCPACGWRGRLPRGHADEPSRGPDLAFWGTLALVAALLVALLSRVG